LAPAADPTGRGAPSEWKSSAFDRDLDAVFRLTSSYGTIATSPLNIDQAAAMHGTLQWR
jgi:hypothetical protein